MEEAGEGLGMGYARRQSKRKKLYEGSRKNLRLNLKTSYHECNKNYTL